MFKIFDDNNLIAIRDNVVQTLGATALRQALLAICGALLPGRVANGAYLEAAALGLLAIGTAIYGQLKTLQQKRKALALADAAEIGRVVK